MELWNGCSAPHTPPDTRQAPHSPLTHYHLDILGDLPGASTENAVIFMMQKL